MAVGPAGEIEWVVAVEVDVLVGERWKPASVNLALAALDSFYTQLGRGRPVVRREDMPAKAPRALTEEQQRRLLRMGERAAARDRAIVVMLLYTGLRLVRARRA